MLADSERLGRAGRVVDSSLAILDHPNRPFGEIARVDELHRDR